MEEQRQRQDSDSKQATEASKDDAPAAEAPVADDANTEEDALLRNALNMSLGGVCLRYFTYFTYFTLLYLLYFTYFTLLYSTNKVKCNAAVIAVERSSAKRKRGDTLK